MAVHLVAVAAAAVHLAPVAAAQMPQAPAVPERWPPRSAASGQSKEQQQLQLLLVW